MPTPSDPQDRNSPPLCTTPPTGTQGPAVERDHNEDYCAIVGGYVVRDPGLPTLLGRYLYGDDCVTELQSHALRGPGGSTGAGLNVPQLSSFGEDACGRIYTASLTGAVSRLQDGAPSACSFPQAQGFGGGPAGVRADRRAPVLRRRAPRAR